MFSNCFRSFQICSCEALKYHQHIKNGYTCQSSYPGTTRIKAMACIAAIDDVEGYLYEIPDYEDSQMLDYEISSMGASPLISVLHLAKKQPSSKIRSNSQKEVLSTLSSELDTIITRLKTIQARIEKGSGTIPYADIEKSIQGLKKLEHTMRPGIQQILSAMRQGRLSKPIHASEIMKVIATEKSPTTEVPTTQAPVYKKKVQATEVPDNEDKPQATEAPVYEMKPKPTEVVIYELKSLITDAPVPEMQQHETEVPIYALLPPSTEAPVEKVHKIGKKPIYHEEVFESESMKEMYEKNPYQSRWTWKTSSLTK
ncbi:uncharacterized protein TNCV_2085411 [Trichonephila clavipes]|uniref:Uncharacterized protein n=1 Tax=Trichonephila clavipes TaxID=2585209 RepID=A0A8X6RQY7_TRICX|nr:uncharacterized protein TNCV_2085411 [Trichonephila clavipes]